MELKICGIRRKEDVGYLNEAPPTYAGFVFAPGKRQVTAGQAASLRSGLNASIRTVGVFVNAPPEEVARCAAQVGLFAVQLHGDEDDAYLMHLRSMLPGVELWRAVRVRGAKSILAACKGPADRLVLDTFTPAAYGGTGLAADWDVIRAARAYISKPFFLAGGLCVENLAAAAALRPDGFDVSSGVETGGIKDAAKLLGLLKVFRALNV